MSSNRRTEGAYDIVAYSGEIDFDHSAAMREEIIQSLDQGQHVLVDLSEVSYIDSSIIASLVQGLQHARNRDLKVDLIGVKDNVLKVLKLTRMDEVFTLHQSVAVAMAAE
jgi:anti-sigma B factor antagonist